MRVEKSPPGAAARIACSSNVSELSIDSDSPVLFLTIGPVSVHAYWRVSSDGRWPENAFRAFRDELRTLAFALLRQRSPPGRVRISIRGPPLALSAAASYRIRTS